MLLQDLGFKEIHEINRLRHKGRNMTLAENDQLNRYYSAITLPPPVIKQFLKS